MLTYVCVGRLRSRSSSSSFVSPNCSASVARITCTGRSSPSAKRTSSGRMSDWKSGIATVEPYPSKRGGRSTGYGAEMPPERQPGPAGCPKSTRRVAMFEPQVVPLCVIRGRKEIATTVQIHSAKTWVNGRGLLVKSEVTLGDAGIRNSSTNLAETSIGRCACEGRFGDSSR